MNNKQIIERASEIIYNLEPDESLSFESIGNISAALMIARAILRDKVTVIKTSNSDTTFIISWE